MVNYIDDKSGECVNLDSGLSIGRHNGIHKLTIGQRCKISGCENAYYVFNKDQKTNTIIAVNSTMHPALYSDFLITEDVHWISEEPRELRCSGVLNCDFRFQHRNPLITCNVYKIFDNRLFIRLSVPLRALTKGQYAVLYSGEKCLGGAIISYPGPSYFALNRQNSISETRYSNLIALTSDVQM